MSTAPDTMTAPAAAAADPATNAQLLSNGNFATLLTVGGGGYAAHDGFAITRWAPDPTCDADGILIYVSDLDSGAHWTVGGGVAGSTHSVTFRENCADLESTDHGLRTTVTVCVASQQDAELRRVVLRNVSDQVRRLAVTSYAELALNTPAGDAAHPAFSKLLVQTVYVPEREALLAWRRPRSPDDRPLWVAHALLAERGAGQPQFETDRARFIGRGRSTAAPAALLPGAALSGTAGSVLDPVFSLRRTIELEPGAEATFVLVLCAASSREVALRTIDHIPHVAAAAPLFASASVPPRDGIAALGLPQRWREGIRFVVTGESIIVSRPRPCLAARPAEPMPRAATEPLEFINGYGGFSRDGSEYVIRLRAGDNGLLRPPLPWSNVIANEEAGCIVTEAGATYTWTANSRENRLTPWPNDPVSDPHGEALYVRDEEDGALWSPTPGPIESGAEYETRHGFGFTRFRSSAHGIDHDTVIFVPMDAPARIARVALTNRSGRSRRLRLAAYAQLVLGSHQADTRGRVVTWQAPTGALHARNPARGEFSGRIAFSAVCGAAGDIDWTTDRAAFLGRYGSPAAPAALRAPPAADSGAGWTGLAEQGADPCFAQSFVVEIPAGATFTCGFLLGEAADEQTADAVVRRFADGAAVDAALDDAVGAWRQRLGATRIDTPVPALDLMVNGWLAYQNLGCRMWARSAYFQSGGAFGFRDQLQDSSALLYIDPAYTRAQILLHAAHQFVEGDVLHWWHPPASKGIRTRFSDDLLWLPYITSFYIARTGDAGILDEDVRYLSGRELEPGEDEEFLVPEESGESGSLYDHCCRVLDRSLTRGAHGLPLMGTGDWNDGMNRVGREGRGESVWLGFFIYDILHDFVPFCRSRGDGARADRYAQYRQELGRALNDGGWDGEWYRRAYYDNGAPLGSARSDECRIDALAQAWAVLSGAAPTDRAEQAIDAMEKHLVSEDEGLIRLLAPAFDRTPHDPGYIKGYIPGVRENGGQYTHGVLWSVRALAELGRTERAARLLEMLSPVTRGGPDMIERYRVEPYVVAADVYGVEPHVGRGGWTWYTGSAGWMYRVMIESILGLELHGGTELHLRPCVPVDWPSYRITHRMPDGTTYDIQVTQAGAHETVAEVDGVRVNVADGAVVVPLAHDGTTHAVRVALGSDVGRRYAPR